MPEPDRKISIEEVIITEELKLRADRKPDYESENRALRQLARNLVQSPETILMMLAQNAAE